MDMFSMMSGMMENMVSFMVAWQPQFRNIETLWFSITRTRLPFVDCRGVLSFAAFELE